MRIGILGGTFDPIHQGHIQPALAVQQQLELDEVWLMPNHIPPHKSSTQVSTAHRLNMVKLECAQHPELKLCDIEINRDSPSYSVVTLQQLSEQYPQHEFYFIMGMDSFVNLDKWHQWQQLFQYCHIALCARPGWQLAQGSSMAKVLAKRQTSHPKLANYSKRASTLSQALTRAKSGNVFIVDAPLHAISSTDIRNELARGLNVKDKLSQTVLDYINQQQLYLT
ncbi:nicotinate-nucleotide adenylyltransferase [Shewanella sp. WXL01]|uniref:Probable nicotinate-nucleotide adenylyltransferase n=1 Tax=Shewanella maritima TaxID=2520507 RepID=A0A411PFF9_9GAMM|nr:MULTISPECIES: nicotinate-nucleotide adenylyltransferase [Shewanella]NKF49572.1 nicotinate-nucleotide adenylyltransferase [Shewanella sp. WXL01]QBF82329.1 nicotinate-nucleotide adenylyltransferase [Shewanella maritima]